MKTGIRDPRQAAERFAGRLAELFAESLRSVVLYGSAARGEYQLGTSDINLLVILRELGPQQLDAAASVAREWVANGNPPPLMLSEREWSTSADVFPIEYSDIRGSHVVLRGPDPFTGMRIDREHLRLQLEHELRSRKIQLREAFLITGSVPDELGAVLVQSLSSFLTLFRAILRLDGAEPPTAAADLIRSVADQVGFAPDPVLEILRHRNAGDEFAASLSDTVPAGYLEAVERTVAWLDRFDSTGRPGEVA